MRVCCEFEITHFVHTVQVHTPLHEEILAPSFSMNLFPLPIQGGLAIFYIREESTESIMADHLQASKETVRYIFAIFQINSACCQLLVAQFCAEAHWQEDGICVCFHRPIMICPRTFCANELPSLNEKRAVDPLSVELPLAKWKSPLTSFTLIVLTSPGLSQVSTSL